MLASVASASVYFLCIGRFLAARKFAMFCCCHTFRADAERKNVCERVFENNIIKVFLKGERDMCGCLHARFITSIRLLFRSKPVMSQLTPFIFCFSRKSHKPGSPRNPNRKLVKLNKRSPKVNPRKVQQDLSQKQPRHKIMHSAYLRHVMASLCSSRSHPVSVKKSRRLTAAG